jgi:hypothetical protein
MDDSGGREISRELLSAFGPDPFAAALVAAADSDEGEVVRGAYEGPAASDLCAVTLGYGVGHSGRGDVGYGVLLLSSVPLSAGGRCGVNKKGPEKKKMPEDRAKDESRQ